MTEMAGRHVALLCRGLFGASAKETVGAGHLLHGARAAYDRDEYRFLGTLFNLMAFPPCCGQNSMPAPYDCLR